MATSRGPERLRRADSFLGIHFDCHMHADYTGLGRHVTARMVERIIEQVRPDYIQCDCKGHPGIASYPTKVGTPAAGFVRDPLRVWRDVTAKHGVALFMHYSGVIDAEACRRHPSWARVDAEGRRDPKVTSVFGPYVDKLLILMLKELADDYGVDGVWVDGECWGTEHDYSKWAREAWRRKTGRGTMPKPGDRGWLAFHEFCRQGFRDYLHHYVTALHAHAPAFQIASNWAYSSHMPEPVGVDVDYLSGDYSMQDSVNAARFEGRCLAGQGRPWDLMAWSFCERWQEGAKSTKSVVQLQQEAAVVLALGGGFQAYFKQKPDASIYDWTMGLMAEAARFCRARQAPCHKAEPVPQVALLYSTDAYYRTCRKVFSPWHGETDALKGILFALLDAQQSVEILMEHSLAGRMADYPLIVVPEWGYLRPSFKRELREYVRGGGSLLLVGPAAARMFQKELRVKLVGKARERAQWLEFGGWNCGLKAVSQRVKLGRGAKAVGKLRDSNERKGVSQPAAAIARLGEGAIAATYVNLGERCKNARTAVLRDFLAGIVRALFPEPLVEVEGSHSVDVSVMRKDDRLLVNLVNTAGPHADPNVYTYDEVPPVGPLTVTIRTGRKPKDVRLLPANRKLRHTYSGGEVRLTLRRLPIHQIIAVTPGGK